MNLIDRHAAEGLISRFVDRITSRAPDFVVGSQDNPYLLRWHVLPKNRFFSLYLHCFLRDDDDRALHDHPWFWCSWLLEGSYVEHTIRAGGVQEARKYSAGSIRMHTPWHAHRIALIDRKPCWTLFFNFARIREWGFHCPEQGWIHWERFTAKNSPGEIGKGCNA